MFAKLQFLFLAYYLSIGMAVAITNDMDFHRMAKGKKQQKQDKQGKEEQNLNIPYRNEPAYGEQSWIFDAINVLGAWGMGYEGKDVRVRINDISWEYNHTEWGGTYGGRLIEFNKNAEEQYSCGIHNNDLPDDGGVDEDDIINHGAAVTSILGADGTNEFCGTGIAPHSLLSFCNYNHETTNATVLMYNVLSQQLTATFNSFDISLNAYAYEGCSSEPRDKIIGLHRKEHKSESDQAPSRHLQKQEEEIKPCPFRNFYSDENNPGNDPCQVCKKSDFDAIDADNRRDNIFETASAKIKPDAAGPASVRKACATSVRAYCSRNFRRDEDLCTEWIEVINNGNICRFKSSVGEEINYALNKGAKEGRFGWGVNFIYAAGDSYGNGDNVNYQAYPKSRYVMTVGAVKMKEFADGDTKILKPIHSTYSTSGSSIFIVAPGGDYDSPYQHVGAGGTEGYGTSCVDIGYGTSFAAPVVAGVVALMLEANVWLTWRDVRTIIVDTSQKVEIMDNENNNDDATFGVNAAGIGYSDLYGFGLIDATAAVKEAESWHKRGFHVPEELDITVESGIVNVDIRDDSFSTSTSTIIMPGDELNGDSMESVSVYLKLRYFNRSVSRISRAKMFRTNKNFKFLKHSCRFPHISFFYNIKITEAICESN
jgi:subtilisin family serine protease